MIISIINNKGGVGKTATAVNLGHALAKAGKKVLVIDMDPQSNSTSVLCDELPQYSLYEIMDPQEDDVPPQSCVCGTRYERLYILPNIPETAMLEPLLIARHDSGFQQFRNRFREYANQNFDIVLVDNPPALGTLVINALRASDFVIVPNEAGSKHSVSGLIKAVNFIEEERINGNPDLRFLKLLVTKVDGRLSVHKSLITQIKDHFPPEKVFETIIPLNTDMQKAELMEKTIFAYKSNATSAIAYKKLAQELIKDIEGI